MLRDQQEEGNAAGIRAGNLQIPLCADPGLGKGGVWAGGQCARQPTKLHPIRASMTLFLRTSVLSHDIFKTDLL